MSAQNTGSLHHIKDGLVLEVLFFCFPIPLAKVHTLFTIAGGLPYSIGRSDIICSTSTNMRSNKCRVIGDPQTMGVKATKWLRKVVGADWSLSVAAQPSKTQGEAPTSIEVELTTPTGESCTLVIDANTFKGLQKESVREASGPSDVSRKQTARNPAPNKTPAPDKPPDVRTKPLDVNNGNFDSSEEADYDENDVLSVSDPTVVPIVCGRSQVRGYLHPFCSAQDKSYILHEGKAITEDRFLKCAPVDLPSRDIDVAFLDRALRVSASQIVYEDLQSKGNKQAKRPTVPRVSGITGTGMSVKEWLQRAGALYGDSVVGQRVACYWGELDSFYPGTVTAYVKDTGAHLVVYDDGDKVRESDNPLPPKL
eukprot:5623828-Pyramimonas_sp.AAC.1